MIPHCYLGVEVGIHKLTTMPARDFSPSNNKDRVIKEGLGDYLPNIPGAYFVLYSAKIFGQIEICATSGS